jgi:hypothetical protein
MKTKFYWVALLASAALIAQVKAGGRHGGGGGGFAMTAHPAPAQRTAPASHSAPRSNFGGGRVMASGPRFSSAGLRSRSSAAFNRHYINSNGAASLGRRQFTAGNINRANRNTRFSNRGNQAITNPSGGETRAIQNQNGRNRLERFGNDSRLGQSRNGLNRRNGAIANHLNDASQVRHGNNLPANWRNHVVARHSANWHRDWDTRRDHRWQGHHCRFINGSWIIFDLGFYPWGPYWYPYDYDYYAYPYSYDPGYYDSGVYQGEEYYGESGYGSSDQYTDSTVAAAQERLAQQGYYRGEIDGIFGPETRRAIARYQSNHGLRVTGALTTDTLRALGLNRVASY